MYMKRQIGRVAEKLIAVEEALLEAAEKYKDVILPGYTHMQRAQPVLFAHHMLCYFAMLERDFKRLEECYDMADMSPIGACALAGTTYPTNPLEEAEDLHFPRSMETVWTPCPTGITSSSSFPLPPSVPCTCPGFRKNSFTGAPANSIS